MSGIDKIPLLIPEVWDASWYRRHVAEVLAKLDTRNSVGEGIVVSSDGNSVATLSATGAISTAINTHKLETDPHPDIIDELTAASSVSATDQLIVSQSGTNKRATVTQAMQAHRDETDPHPDLIDDLTAATAVALTDELIVSQSGTNKRATVEKVRDIVFGDDWTDLVIPAVAINPAGAANPPTLNNATGCLEFSATSDNVVIFTWQLPHGWSGQYDATKAVVVPHLHVRYLTSTSAPNNVSRWKLEYDVADPFGNFTNAYGTFTAMATVSVTNPANTALCGLIDLGDLDLASYGASCILHCKVSRLAASDGADTDTSVIALYSADLHYQTRTAGTENEIPD